MTRFGAVKPRDQDLLDFAEWVIVTEDNLWEQWCTYERQPKNAYGR